jgi:hypothetical protein
MFLRKQHCTRRTRLAPKVFWLATFWRLRESTLARLTPTVLPRDFQMTRFLRMSFRTGDSLQSLPSGPENLLLDTPGVDGKADPGCGDEGLLPKQGRAGSTIRLPRRSQQARRRGPARSKRGRELPESDHPFLRCPIVGQGKGKEKLARPANLHGRSLVFMEEVGAGAPRPDSRRMAAR